jgi:hypothetical protein
VELPEDRPGLDLETLQQQTLHKDLMEKTLQLPTKLSPVVVVELPVQDLVTYIWVAQAQRLPFQALPKPMALADRVVEELAQRAMLQGRQTPERVEPVDMEETLLQEEIRPVKVVGQVGLV